MRSRGKSQLPVNLLTSFFSIALTHSTYGQAQKLRVAHTAFAGTFTILWVGKDSGLYRTHGADMDLLYIGSSTKSVQALLGGVDVRMSS